MARKEKRRMDCPLPIADCRLERRAGLEYRLANYGRLPQTFTACVHTCAHRSSHLTGLRCVSIHAAAVLNRQWAIGNRQSKIAAAPAGREKEGNPPAGDRVVRAAGGASGRSGEGRTRRQGRCRAAAGGGADRAVENPGQGAGNRSGTCGRGVRSGQARARGRQSVGFGRGDAHARESIAVAYQPSTKFLGIL